MPGNCVDDPETIKEISVNVFYRADASLVDEAISIPALSFQGIDFVFSAGKQIDENPRQANLTGAST